MYKERSYTNEKYMVAMTVSMEHAGKGEGRVRPGTGEIEISIKTPDTEAGRNGLDKLVEIIKKIPARKNKRKVLETLHVATGYGICLADAGMVEKESIEHMIAAAVCIAESKIEKIREEKGGRT